MRVFVTGATGFIGSAIVRELLDAGHQVLGLARSDAAAASLSAAGAEAHRGALDDLDSLRAGAASADGVIHAAFGHDFSDYAGAARTDLRAVETLGAALAGSDRPFVTTSVTFLLTPGQRGTEDDPADPASPSAVRMAAEETALSLATRGVRTSVVRLPPSVHGEGDRAFVPTLIGIARAQGVSAYVGDGSNRWPAVHRLDAARLYRLALEEAPPGSRLHAVADEGVPAREIADVIGRRLNLPVAAVPGERAEEHFGWIGHFFSADNPVSSALTRKQLNWDPIRPALLPDLDQGHYFDD
ncbi:putative NAD-dependent epimerase/dehydratase [Streptomyces hygroscopicus subsp. sporocinereus]|uniref:NAD-dependent epimerase/dehydratase n=1 Tax=Streptomyces hygroscopicus TaxID=1912 RepID=A0ABQ3U704_STRHY|nr:SDR family oxidoreductase [Streptomyces hygroscopicus]GHJ31383.1 putative NAD-dependent epimerase/dehydratase [Streptomyces hygroscopicus]